MITHDSLLTPAMQDVHFYEIKTKGFKKIETASMRHVPAVGNYFMLRKTQELFLIKDIINDASTVFVMVEKSSKYPGIINDISSSGDH